MTGPRMDLKLLGHLGHLRRLHSAQAAGALADIVDHLLDVEEAGGPVSVRLACKVSGVPRSTMLRTIARRRDERIADAQARAWRRQVGSETH